MSFSSFRSINNSQDKIADLFDLNQEKGESSLQYRQRIVSMSDNFKSKVIVKEEYKQSTTKDLSSVLYSVIGYDEFLVKMRRQKAQAIHVFQIGTKKIALELFKSYNFIKGILPEKYIDHNGNVWQKLV